MIEKQDYRIVGRASIADLEKGPFFMWQHRHYGKIVLFMSFVLPALVAHYGWGDMRGGIIYAGFMRLVLVHHATFAINSLAHTMGNQPFSDYHSARDWVWTSLATFGEGYHNMHHEFANDYRNGIVWYAYDPTKWLIAALEKARIAWDLKRTSTVQLEIARMQMKQHRLNKYWKQLEFPTEESLPEWTVAEYKERVRTSQGVYCTLAGIVYDVTSFLEEHPGGRVLLTRSHGLDMTEVYEGRAPDNEFMLLHEHSKFARSRLRTLWVARLKGGPAAALEVSAEHEKSDVDAPKLRKKSKAARAKAAASTGKAAGKAASALVSPRGGKKHD